MMSLSMVSQTTSKPIVKHINENGDTVMTIHMSDARIILKGLMGQTIGDSIIARYQYNESINKKTIVAKDSEITLLKLKNGDFKLIIDVKTISYLIRILKYLSWRKRTLS